MRRLLLAAIVIITLILGLGGADLYNFAHRENRQSVAKIVTIANGSTLKNIAATLERQGVISSRRRFVILNRLLGNSAGLKAGEYRIPPTTTPLEIIAILKSGVVVERRLSIPEGFTQKQIRARLAARKICKPERFDQLCRDTAWLHQWRLPASGPEGYLFPSTYSFTRTTTCRQFLEKMLTTGNRKWREISSASPPSALTRHQVLTLASIIQKEAGNDDEMPLIASVFLNRLEKGMRLASDPTTIYALGDDFDGNLRRRDLKNPSPYNTYQHKGLPPGPICNPGASAIRAVLNPARTDYLYFVSRNNGRHQFSRTFKEHNRAVRKYQLKQKR
ncbi:MAG: endolytic transglycosylase MltG [Deltaproteobacteria bacterium]|nr:endolytic transglycosylase MltG [Deltaproteobacteria bacterium]